MKIFSSFIVVLLLAVSCNELDNESLPEQYNVVWNSQSKNASESMPLVGGDIGCNVWLENGDLLLYMQRSGSLDENGEYLKLGRFRIQLNPNPFIADHSFRQELKLEEGYIEIESKNDEKKTARIKLWVDVFSPVVHVDVETAEKTEVNVAYESWRTDDKELAFGKERFGAFGLEGYSGMIGLQEMLMQTFDEKILLFPAWPKEWDVDFKLYAPGNTTVECSLKEGEIVRLEVTPRSQKEDIINCF